MSEENKFDCWAILELFGHQRIAGRVTEEVIASQGFIRVDVPGQEKQKEFTRLFGPGAIYSIIPTTEDIVIAFLKINRTEPIRPYELFLPLLTTPVIEDEEDEQD